MVGGRASQAYFDMVPAPGRPEQVSGIVIFPAERKDEPLADIPIGLAGPPGDAGCSLSLKAPDADSDGAAWHVVIESAGRVTGADQMADGHTVTIAYDVVHETPCDGAGEWRRFSSAQWPITFDYPANWVLTADGDDINVECPSVTRLANGGSYLTFERGRFPPARTNHADGDRSFTEPYWFARRRDGDWRVKATSVPTGDLCSAGTVASDRFAIDCPPARRSERHGMTVLQGAAGEHRRYRAGIGYLGQGGGITRYLFVLGEEWISLDSAGANGHYDDIGSAGGPVLLDGTAVGDRIVRSVKRP